ncbi:MAG: hypothetical protein LBD81_00280, partial [Holosporaceae bacterium]|nr:hypothetical protein [Holosporaceae bacterium]
MSLLLITKISYNRRLLFLAAACFCFAEAKVENGKKRRLHEIVQENDYGDDSIWESDPIEIYSAKIQILDKISGKVYREVITHNSTKIFGSIEIKLKRC